MREIKSIKSNIVPVSSGLDIAAEIQKYKYVLIIKTNEVVLIRGDEKTSLDNVVELRAFSPEKELHIIKNGPCFIGRVREDGKGTETGYCEEQQLLWGHVISSENGSAQLYDDRGIDLSVPISANKNDRILLTVRSYLSDENFEFVDYRLVDLSSAKVGEKDA